MSERTPSFPVRTIFLILLALVTIGLVVYESKQYVNPVPESVSRQVSFTVYYPDQRKLPAGYTLDTKSIRASKQVILYSVNGPKGITVYFSVQNKLTDSQIETFYKTSLIQHTDVATSIGTARIGAVGNQSVTSLPTNGNAWVVLTAPGDINQAQLRQIIHAIRS